MSEVVLGVAIALGLVVVVPAMAIMAFVRVRHVERRLNELERRLSAVASAHHEPVIAAAVMPASAVPAALAIPETRVAPIEAQTPIVTPPAAVPEAPVPAPAATRPTLDWETIIAGRWLNRVGLLAVAVGVAYFLKYAIDNDWIGPHGQVALGLLLGAGLVFWSESLTRRGWHYFADGIVGLGSAILYLSLWAGTSYYRFIQTDAGFAAMIVVTAAMTLIAFGRNRPPVAVLGLIGGFLTPWLVSTGQDAQVALFSYIALLDLALLALARWRDWRFLDLPAFVFTQGYFWAWYTEFYSDDVRWRTSGFAVLFFLLFTALPTIRIRRLAAVRIEHGLLFVVNAAVLVMALASMHWLQHRWTLTAAVLALAAFHLALARAVPPSAPREAVVRLVPAGLALTLTVIAIAIRLEGQWITIAWAVEAAVLAWTGFESDVRFARRAAYVMFLAVAFRLSAWPIPASAFLWNARLSTVLVIAASAAVTVWSARRHRDRLFAREGGIVALLVIVTNVLLLWALTLEVDLYFQIGSSASVPPDELLLARGATISLLWTVYATALLGAGVRLRAPAVRWQGLALFGITTLKVFFGDLAYLSGLYRIVSSVVLGLVLLIVSFVYQRSIAARRPAQENAP